MIRITDKDGELLFSSIDGVITKGVNVNMEISADEIPDIIRSDNHNGSKILFKHKHFDYISLAGLIPNKVELKKASFIEPPIGLQPKQIYQECASKWRLEEIEKAISRYENVKKDIPVAWYEELVELNRFLRSVSND